MSFPINRLRRLRRTPSLRRMVRETRVLPSDLISPIFVVPGAGLRRPIASLPGQYQLSVDCAKEEAKGIYGLGIPAVLLFGVPETKDEIGSSAWSEHGVVQRAVSAIKEEVPGLIVITDLCFCEYTSHGHCGLIRAGDVDNDATLQILAKQSLSHAQAGADIIAPSGMIDGAVMTIRQCLDENGFSQTAVLSYAVKFASSFYGPFREAAQCAPQFGDRKTYQMDPANIEEALREAALDVEEGADMIMIKPALAYLDIIRLVKDEFGLPTAAYNVSGEYAMLKAAAERGWLDASKAMIESLTAIRRAGADMIVTYFAREFAELHQRGLIED